MLRLEGKGDELDDFWKIGIWREQVLFDVFVRGFNSRRCAVVEVGNLLGPSIRKRGSMGNPGLFKIRYKDGGIKRPHVIPVRFEFRDCWEPEKI